MRKSVILGWNLVLGGAILVFASGCLFKKSEAKTPFANPPGTIQMTDAQGRVVTTTPGARSAGQVVKVNSGSQFVVLTFPIGSLPAPDQRLHVYRNGLKVAEVVVTGPVLDDNIVADVVAGTVQLGYETRSD
jgi:hypothetical protein